MLCNSNKEIYTQNIFASKPNFSNERTFHTHLRKPTFTLPPIKKYFCIYLKKQFPNEKSFYTCPKKSIFWTKKILLFVLKNKISYSYRKIDFSKKNFFILFWKKILIIALRKKYFAKRFILDVFWIRRYYFLR